MRPDMLFEVAGLLISSMTVVTLVGSISFMCIAVNKVTLEKLTVPWNGLDEAKISDENWLLQWDF